MIKSHYLKALSLSSFSSCTIVHFTSMSAICTASAGADRSVSVTLFVVSIVCCVPLVFPLPAKHTISLSGLPVIRHHPSPDFSHRRREPFAVIVVVVVNHLSFYQNPPVLSDAAPRTHTHMGVCTIRWVVGEGRGGDIVFCAVAVRYRADGCLAPFPSMKFLLTEHTRQSRPMVVGSAVSWSCSPLGPITECLHNGGGAVVVGGSVDAGVGRCTWMRDTVRAASGATHARLRKRSKPRVCGAKGGASDLRDCRPPPSTFPLWTSGTMVGIGFMNELKFAPHTPSAHCTLHFTRVCSRVWPLNGCLSFSPPYRLVM